MKEEKITAYEWFRLLFGIITQHIYGVAFAIPA
jgi:hypothetical protein